MKEIEAAGKTVDEAVNKALNELGVEKDQVEIEVLSDGSKGILGLLTKSARVRVKIKPDPAGTAFRLISRIVSIMKVKVSIDIEQKDDEIRLYLQGLDAGLLIGRRGQTLDALQYIISLAVNKHTDRFTRVILDVEGYRKKREKTLKKLALKLAAKVKKTRKDIELEPMPPHERRIIHTALQNDDKVKTYSEGEEPYRKVIVALKQ